MFYKYFLIVYYFIVVDGRNSYEYDQENCNYLRDDYNTLYNTSLNLYIECVSQLENTVELYDNELMVTDICMEKLQKCENNTSDLTSSVNYTKQVKVLKNNIELESAMLLLKKKIVDLEEKNTIAYSLINDYKEENLNLTNTFTNTIHDLYATDEKLNQCKMDLQNQFKNYDEIFSNLNACLEREELTQDQKNKYVIRLTSCRKNNKKLKDRC